MPFAESLKQFNGNTALVSKWCPTPAKECPAKSLGSKPSDARWLRREEAKDPQETQDEIARIRKRKRGRNMLNRSGNTTDNLCFRYRFRDVFSRFRCCVYNGTRPLLRKHNGNMELPVSATFQKYGNMWFRPVKNREQAGGRPTS